MRPWGYVTRAASAVALIISGVSGLTACTGGDGAVEGGDSAGGDAPSVAQAPSGRHDTLPEPCGAVPVETLRALLPGAAEDKRSQQPDDSSPGPYQGEAEVTYDTDRRVGCHWKDATGLGSHQLRVDFQRAVSYDTAVSDEEQAGLLFEDKAEQAEIPASAPSEAPPSEDDSSMSSTPSSSAGDSADSSGKSGEVTSSSPPGGTSEEPGSSGAPSDDSDSSDAAGSAPESSASGDTDSSSDPDSSDALEWAPRPLDGIGDAAYVDDVLDTTASGSSRRVTVVFRTANVIVTVEYAQWAADGQQVPESDDLQGKASRLAGRLASEFGD